jgi:hypothetical protein
MSAIQSRAEHALFQSERVFHALRSVGFLISETQGNPPSEWTGEPIQDLGTLIELLAEHGAQITEEALDNLTVPNVA